ncbi:MAG: hypothetical protein AAFW98_09155 [Pseudomonadota bacterium]
MSKKRLKAILDEFHVRIVPTNIKRRPRSTHAGTVLLKHLKAHGEDHMRALLTCVVETQDNESALISPIISATSRLLLAHAHWWESNPTAWLEVFDATDLVDLYQFVKGNQREVSSPEAIAQELYQRLVVHFGDPMAPKPKRPPSIDRVFDLTKLMVIALGAAQDGPDGLAVSKTTRSRTWKALRRRDLITRQGLLTERGRDAWERLVARAGSESVTTAYGNDDRESAPSEVGTIA